jgi:hypothetical protein
MKAAFAVTRTLPGSILATTLTACGPGGASPAPGDSPPPPVSIVGQCAPELASQVVTEKRIADSICAQPPGTERQAVGRFPLLATEARPADVDAGGGNEIGIEERKVAAVAVAAITDALQRGLVGGLRYGAGLHGGSFAVAWGPQLTLTLFNCAYTADVWVSGLVTWAHADIFGSGGFLPAYRPLTADLVVSGPGTVGGTLHVAGSWRSNDPDGRFSVTGALGGKQVAVLVPEHWVAPVASQEGSHRCFRAQTAASVILEELADVLSCTPRGPARQPHQPLFTARSVSWLA